MRNKILALCLLTAVSTTASDFRDSLFNYTITSPTTVSIALNDPPAVQGRIVLPETVMYQGHELTVTALSREAFRCAETDEVVLPPTITTLGDWAFQLCPIRHIDLPASVRVIGEGCFCQSSLESIELPDSLKSIGNEVFSGSKLTAIRFPEGLTSIGANAFANCKQLGSLDFPASLRTISYNAFSWCDAIERITFRGPLESIAGNAFQGDTQLREVIFGGAVKELNGFDRCTSLERIAIPEGTQKLGSGVFQGCTSLKEVTFPLSVSEIGQSVFQECTSLNEVVLPPGLANIQMWLFNGCSNLEAITIGENVEGIGSESIDGCTKLKRIIVRRPTPPSYGSSNFTQEIIDLFNRAEVIVPTDCKNAYASADFWKNFKHISEQDMGAGYHGIGVWVGEGGTVESSGLTMSHGDWRVIAERDQPVTFTIRPDSLHQVSSVELLAPDSGGWQPLGDQVKDGRLTLEKVKANSQIHFSFKDAWVSLDILQNEMGRVRLSVAKNREHAFRILEEEGWQLHSVSFNGEDITSRIGRGNYALTPVVTYDSVVRIAFEASPSGIMKPRSGDIRVVGTDEGLAISQGQKGQHISIYTSGGRLVSQLVADGSTVRVPLRPGAVYLVKTNGKTVKIRL